MTATLETGALDLEGALEGAELVAWLESPEGEAWSKGAHRMVYDYSRGAFGEIKEDHRGECPPIDGSDIERANNWGGRILMEIAWYGMNGLPPGSVQS
jgi:hypothetical protein